MLKFKFTKALSIFLSVLIILTVIPPLAVSAEDTSQPNTATYENNTANTDTQPHILYEITEKRELDTKHFLMSDGSYLAAKYNYPVHYEENGSYFDIDNSISISENENNTLENKNNSYKIKFSKKSKENKIVTMSKGNYKLTWALDGVNKVNATYTTASNEEVSLPVLKNLNGTVEYSEIMTSTDINYVVSANAVKENIVLKDKEAPDSFTFNYKLNNLEYRINQDGDIELFDMSAPDEVVFFIEKPYMFDANKYYSDDIEMLITETNNGFELSLIPDSEWLSSPERAYPIVIDPTTLSSQVRSLIWDIDMMQGQSQMFSCNAEDLVVGVDNQGRIFRSVIKFNGLPTLTPSDIIVNANLYITAYQGPAKTGAPALRVRPSGNPIVNIHRMTNYWPETTDWNTSSQHYNPIVEDYFVYNTTDDQFKADITEIAAGWYKGEYENYGVMLKSADEGTANRAMQFTSSDWGYENETHMSWRPVLTLNYRNTLGLEDYWSYTSQDAGRYGVGYVNNYNGNLVYVKNDTSFNSGITGFSLSHIYNTGTSANSGRYGNGWRVNLVQKLEPVTIPSNSYVKYAYTDGDGTIHYFVQTNDGRIMDEDGLGLTATTINETTDNGTTPLTLQITTKDDTIMKFDTWGFLRRIIDSNGNTISLHYAPGSVMEDNQLRVITTSTGGYFTLIYDSNYILTSIIDNAQRTTTFTYDAIGNLSTITTPDGVVQTFSYNNKWLTGFSATDNTELCYEHYANSGKIYRAYHKSTDNVQGAATTFVYSHNQTEITDSAGRKLTYQFDTYGRPTCIYDENQNIYSLSYTETAQNGLNPLQNNKQTLTSNGSVYVNNLLTNPVFANGLDGWTQYTQGTTPILEVVTNNGLLSNKSIKTSLSESGSSLIMQNILINTPGTYTLSGYIKTENVIPAHHGAGLEVMITSDSGDKFYYSEPLTGSTDTTVNNGFEHVFITFELKNGETINRISAGMFYAIGTAYIDSLQLEEGNTANPINLIDNSSFEFNSGSESIPNGYAINFSPVGGDNSTWVAGTQYQKFGNFACRIVGQYFQSKHIMKTINTGGKAGDVFSFGAWTWADSVTSGSNYADFYLCIEFSYANGVTDNQYSINLNRFISGWQHDGKTVVAKYDYTAITIYLCYYDNCNVAFFDCVYLYHDTAQSYQYDNEGNVVSTADYAKQQSTFNYSGNNISSVFNPDGTGFEYTYNDKNNLIFARSTEGLQSNISYDSYGNATSTQISKNNYSAALADGKTYYIRLKNTGKYLTAENSGTAVNTNVIQSDFTGGNNQKWVLEKTTDGYFYLHPAYLPGMSLEVTNGSQSTDGNIAISTNNQSDAQKFLIESKSNYTYSLATKCLANKLVTVYYAATNNNVCAIDKSGELNGDQIWYFEDVEQPPATQIEDGAVYQLRIRNSGKYIDVSNNSTEIGTKLTQCKQNYGDNQKYYICKYENTDYYTISPVSAPNRLVEVSTALGNAGYTYIQLGDNTVTDRKLFKFVYNSSMQGFQIIPKSNESLALDLAYGSTANGAELIFTGIGTATNRYFLAEKISDVITSSATYQDNGNYPHTVTDSRGKTTTYTYDTARGLQTAVTAPNGSVTSYSYEALTDRLQSVTSGNSTVSYNYLTNGALNRLTAPSGTVYSFAYDTFGRTSSIAIGSRNLSTTEYLNNYSSLVSKFIYGNGVYKNYTYDNLDRVLTESINGTQILSYLYDKRGNLVRVNDLQANVVTDFVFDLIGRPQGIKMSNGQRLHISYDNLNRVSLSKWSLNGISQLTEYIYGSNTVSGQKNGLIYGVKNNGSQVISYSYDELCRLAARTLNTTTPFITEYGYLEGATENTTTTLIKTLKNGNDVYEYAYDDVGNITQVKLNNVVTESYTYDSLGQLTSATYNGDSYTYSYDNGGNITEVKKNGTVIKSYDYGDSEWKDLLTAFNGTAITYDTIGNPLSYRDGYTFTWANGRQLAAISQNNNALANYTYNADGLRTSKTVNGVTTNYYWINGILQGQKTGDEYIIFLYDESGTAYGMLIKNGTTESTYYYVRNLQGDIVGILDSNGTQVVSYTYGAWGDVISVSGTLANTIGQQNPLRYRGYYYDNETGFYYLQSRYYDTVAQRFVNADGLVSTGQGILGSNMFAYCGNNPIMFSDPSGMSAYVVIEEIVKKLLVVTATFMTATILPTLQKGLNDLGASISAGASVAADETKSFLGSFASDYMPSKAKSKEKTHPKNTPYNYWAADLICKQIVVTTPLTADEAALRVSKGKSIMCRNENAARYILFVNGYINAIGPEKGKNNGYYWHFHPTRNHTGYDSIHIWFYK